MIIDPRAGHGAGIGGFKPDSQVGVALHDGHPVYFVGSARIRSRGRRSPTSCARRPSSSRRSRGAIRTRRSQSSSAIARAAGRAMILAAANPDISGPLVDQRRAALLLVRPHWREPDALQRRPARRRRCRRCSSSDLGDGEFDGAYLVSNFEQLNPARHFFGEVLRTLRQAWIQTRSASSNSSAGGAAIIS